MSRARRISAACALICLTTLLAVSGCANITPQTPKVTVVAYSGNDQNAGIVAFLPQGGYEITESARERYNSFVANYGAQTMPPTAKDFGIKALANGHYSLTFEAAARWRRMILLHHRTLQRKAGSLTTKVGL